MKRINLIGACVVAAACASFASVSYAYATPPLAEEMALAANQGVSPARAAQALELQSEVAGTHLGSRITAALAGAYAGVWFEPAAAKFHVGVTSSASRQEAERAIEQAGLTADAVITPVRSTWAALIAAQNRWNERLSTLLAAGQAATGIDVPGNAVSVTLSSTVPSPVRAVLEGEAATSGVNVSLSVSPPSTVRVKPQLAKTCETKFTPGKAFCEEQITAGVGLPEVCGAAAGEVAGGYKTLKECEAGKGPGPGGLWTSSRCTAGPMLIKGLETYMLTAGHCFGFKGAAKGEKLTDKVTSAYPNPPAASVQKEIGNEVTWFQNKERDVAEVKVNRPGPWTAAGFTPVPALMAEWAGAQPEKPHAVEGVLAPIAGQFVCHEGITSGEECGTILTVEKGVVGETQHLVETNACGEAGDSGGPWFLRLASGPHAGQVLMEGTDVGGNEHGVEGKEKCPAPDENPKTDFEPLETNPKTGLGTLEAEAFKGQEVLTKANENQAPHWYNNGVLSPEGEKVPTVTWGTLALESAAGKVECKNVIGGYVENPVGGGAGVDAVRAVGAYECASTCPVESAVTAEGLPWPTELVEVGGKIRDRITGMQLRLKCEFESTVLLNTVFSGNNDPEPKNGTAAGKPSELRYTGTGIESELRSPESGPGIIEGKVKTQGNNATELTTEKSPPVGGP